MRRGLPGIDNLFQDVQYGVRMLRKSPGFALMTVLTLAVGIGVNTTLFTAFNTVALRPAPAQYAHGCSIRDDMAKEIDAVLNEEQRKKFEEMLADMGKKKKKAA